MTNGRRARFFVIGHLGIDSSFGFRHSTFSPVGPGLPSSGADQRPTSKTRPCKTKSPRPVFRLNEGKLGAGSSPCSLSHADIRRLLRGCQLPDAILHGKRSFRPHSRAVQRLSVAELLSEASWLAWAGVCGRRLANQVKTRMRFQFHVLTIFHWVGHRFWRCVGPVPRV